MTSAAQLTFQRYEVKYFLTPAQQEALLKGIRPHMRPDDYGQYTICSLYYDTPDWQIIRTSLEKPAYKEKLRVRSYGVPGQTGPVFAELKKKCQGIVYKRRVTVPADQAAPLLSGALPPEDFGQTGREIAWFQSRYAARPRVMIAYDRRAFAGVQDPELRLTLDTGIRFRTRDLDLRRGDWGQALLPEDRILLELKLPGTAPLWLSRLLAGLELYPTSFSKYGACYGIHLLPGASKSDKEAFFCA